MEIQHEIDKLRREIEYHSKLYYVMPAGRWAGAEPV